MSSSESEDVYDVEAIVDHRLKNGCVEYLIKWEGYESSANTWEPKSNLDKGSLQLAKEYHLCKRESRENLKRVKTLMSQNRRLERPRHLEGSDSDEDFFANTNSGADGRHHSDHAADNNPVTPSPQRSSRAHNSGSDQEVSSDNDDESSEKIVMRRGARRKILLHESEESDASSDDGSDLQQNATPTQSNLISLKRPVHHESSDSDVEFLYLNSPKRQKSAGDTVKQRIFSNTSIGMSDCSKDTDDYDNPVTPSPKRPFHPRSDSSDNDYSNSDDFIEKGERTRCKMGREDSDSDYSDNSSDDESDFKPSLPSSQSNLSSSPRKLKTTCIKCPSKRDALTNERLPFPSKKPHVCYDDPEGIRHCYALETLYRKALENHEEGETFTLLQPPHFDTPMSEDLKDQISCRFGRRVLTNTNYRRYYRRYVYGVGTHDLYCCPICYNEAYRRQGGKGADDDDEVSDSENEYEDDCFTFDDDPMTILENIGFYVASTFSFLKMGSVRRHLKNEHNVDLKELKDNDLFKRFRIKSPDGLLQHFVRSNSKYKDDMWRYWRDRDWGDERNIDKLRDLVQIVVDTEEKKPSASHSDFCTSFPNRAQQIWDKVSGPYTKKGVSDDEEGKFINDNESDSSDAEIKMRENPYAETTDESEEDEVAEYIEGLKERVEQSRRGDTSSSSSDERESSDDESREESDTSEESDDASSERSDSEEDDLSGDPWLKQRAFKKSKQKQRSKNDEASDDEAIFDSDNGQCMTCAKFTACDGQEEEESDDDNIFSSDVAKNGRKHVKFTASDDDE